MYQPSQTFQKRIQQPIPKASPAACGLDFCTSHFHNSAKTPPPKVLLAKVLMTRISNVEVEIQDKSMA